MSSQTTSSAPAHNADRALENGTEMLELDCHLTKDGEVVISHDDNLQRSTGYNYSISQLTYKELPLLKTELPLDFIPGCSFIGSEDPKDRRFTLLRDVFQEFPGIPINIDIKVDDDNLIRKVSDLIKQYHREEITVWGNFSDVITRKCYSENPRVNLLFSMWRVVNLVALLYSGLLPFVPLKETHLEIFLPSIYSRRKNNLSAAFLPMSGLLVKMVDVLLMRRSLFEHLSKRGIQCYMWVLNSEDEFKTAFELGATGVITDYPTKLRKFLEDNSQYR
uniref:GP-PDE domain-containing protein n=2 Tax=Timema TaxID=61471 RepID=A0A7R9AXP1_TIMSH|nr:unnamed protein product [Timema shepardi]CAD7567876.1 unnamed protein product [Timema californicum]